MSAAAPAPSPWSNYVCLDTTEVLDADNTVIGTVGELLCNCGGFESTGCTDQCCDENDNPDYSLGDFSDPNLTGDYSL